jgi:hypothetical protein
MKVVLSRVFDLTEEQVKAVQAVSNECELSLAESVEAMFMDGQLDLENFNEDNDKIIWVG